MGEILKKLKRGGGHPEACVPRRKISRASWRTPSAPTLSRSR